MSNDVKIVSRSSDAGVVWFIGWLFTIGFCNLHLAKGALALVLWPYYLGVALKH